MPGEVREDRQGRRGRRGGKRLNLVEYLAFRLGPIGRSVPAASSGKKYRTLDERCGACEIYGGEEEPCQNRGILKAIQINLGRPCPRVDLFRENVDAAHLAMLSLSPSPAAHRLLPIIARERLRHHSGPARLAICTRAAQAVTDEKVVKLSGFDAASVALLGALFNRGG